MIMPVIRESGYYWVKPTWWDAPAEIAEWDSRLSRWTRTGEECNHPQEGDLAVLSSKLTPPPPPQKGE